MLNDKTIFLTGGAGFIGATLTGRLHETNRIVIFDNFKRDSLSDRPWSSHPNVTVVRGDVTNSTDLGAAIEKAQPNVIVHLAAIAGIDTVIQSPTTTMRVNMIGTVNALEAAARLKNLERFVDFSTSEVFGSYAFRADETQMTSVGAVGEARWIYAVSKLAGEHLVHAYHREFGMPTVTLRPFNVYGPGQIGEGAIHRFVVDALRDQDIEIHGDGTQIRAWCYVDDMVRGVLLALDHPNAVGESFNIGNQRAVTTIYGLASTVIRITGSTSTVSFVDKDYVDVELRVPSVTKARELIGFEAQVDLDEGIAATAAFVRAQLERA